MKSLIIGITGGSGSGKSQIARDLAELLSPNATILALDNYYYPIEKQPKDINGRPNFDLPESLDLQKFKHHLIQLSNGANIKIKEYTFNNPDLKPKTIEIFSKPIIITEGLFILNPPEMELLISIKIYIDVKEDIKLERRMKRDLKSRGYNLDDVNYCHINHVLPSFNKFIKPQKEKAGFVVANNGEYNDTLERIKVFLKKKLDPYFLFF